MAEKVLFFQPKKCIGCRICEQWCVFTHHDVINPAKSRIRVYRDTEKQLNFALYCHLCIDPPCISACEFDALSTDNKTGAIIVDIQNCTGCGQCIESCPFDAIFMFPGEDYTQVCDLCQGEPNCVKHCPEQAIQYINRSEVTF
ncbi:MAG: 4Fe-4S dicluster domain-containing protein [Promethearchaeota archaeon]